MTEQQALPENWQELDYVRSYYEGMAAIGEQVRAGRPLPAMFVPRDEGEGSDRTERGGVE